MAPMLRLALVPLLAAAVGRQGLQLHSQRQEPGRGNAKVSLREPGAEAAPSSSHHHKHAKLNPFSEIVKSINLAIDTITDGLSSSTKEIVHSAASEMKETGERLRTDLKQSVKGLQREIATASPGPVEPASLLGVDVETQPRAEMQPRAESRAKACVERARAGLRLRNPFKGFIHELDSAIVSIADTVDRTSREIVRTATDGLRETRQQLQDIGRTLPQPLVATEGAHPMALFQADVLAEHEHQPRAEFKAEAKQGHGHGTESDAHSEAFAGSRIRFPLRGLLKQIDDTMKDITGSIDRSSKDMVQALTSGMKDTRNKLQELSTALPTSPERSGGARPMSLLAAGTAPAHGPALEANSSGCAEHQGEERPFSAAIDAIRNIHPGRHFNNLVGSFKTTMNTITDRVDRSTREMVKTATEGIKETGRSFREQARSDSPSGAPMSLLEAGARPERLAAGAEGQGEAKKAKGKLHFDPFKDLVSGINSAIGSITDSIDRSTREIVKTATSSMEETGKQFANLAQAFPGGLEQEIKVKGAPAAAAAAA